MKSQAQTECPDRAGRACDHSRAPLRQHIEGASVYASSSAPPPLPRRKRWQAATKALAWIMVPLLAGAAAAATAALPLVLTCGLDLLPRGNNGLGLGLLAALGMLVGVVTAAVGEVILLVLWVKSLRRRRRQEGAVA